MIQPALPVLDVEPRTEPGKVCTKCGQWRSFAFFTPNPRMNDGHASWCKICNRDQYQDEKNAAAAKKRNEKRRKKHHLQSDCIYAITDGEFTKVGYSKGDVLGRMERLQVGNARELSLVCFIKDGAAKDLELVLHYRFRDKKVRGEWYRLDDDDLDYLRELAG